MPPGRAGAISRPHTEGGSVVPPDIDPGGTFAWQSLTSAARLASPRKVFPHFFPPFAPSIDNQPLPDYWTNGYNRPGGDPSNGAAYGGIARNRPTFVGPRPLAGDYELTDFRREVAQAYARGFDGFTVDLIGTDTGAYLHRRQLNICKAAALEVPTDFKIFLMPDAFTGFCNDAATAAQLCDVYADAAGDNVFTIDGKIAISPFFAENKSNTFWQSFMSIMQNTYSRPVSFVPCGLNPSISTFQSYSAGISYWGGRSTASTTSSVRDQVLATGLKFMMPVAFQDYRPNQSTYDEAGNTDTLRLGWEIARGGAHYVQIPTWNDYSEHAEICSSDNFNGTNVIDLMSYFIDWFKAGVAPTVTRDALYLTHRKHPYAAATPSQSLRANLRAGSTPARDTVEILSFLAASKRIDVTIGGVAQWYTAPAGMYAKTYALAPGSITATVQGSVSVTSPWTVTNTPSYQNLQYHMCSSDD